MAKVFECIVHQWLYGSLQEDTILHLTQSGFIAQHSTQDVLVSIVDGLWRKVLDENRLDGCVPLLHQSVHTTIFTYRRQQRMPHNGHLTILTFAFLPEPCREDRLRKSDTCAVKYTTQTRHMTQHNHLLLIIVDKGLELLKD